MDGAFKAIGILAFFLLTISLCIINYGRKSRLKREIIREYGSIKDAPYDSDLVTSFQRNRTGFIVTMAILLLGIAGGLYLLFFGVQIV